MGSWRINKLTEQKKFLRLINFPLKDKAVLDAGCGFGYDDDFLYKKGAKVFGIDASPQMISIAKEKYPHLSSNFFVGNIRKLPFKNNFFDIIISKYVLHYLNVPDLAFKEFFRCLKNRGVLIFSVHHPISNFFLKKHKDYFKKEKIRVKILKKIEVTQTTHPLTDYLSEYFLNHFDIKHFEENRGNIILSPQIKIPEYLLIKAVKKKK